GIRKPLQALAIRRRPARRRRTAHRRIRGRTRQHGHSGRRERYAPRRGRESPRAAGAPMNARHRQVVITAITAITIVAPRAHAQRLFRTDSTLTVTITTDLGLLLKQRDSLELVKHPAVFSYDADGKPVSVRVRLRARGHFRRQAHNCDFPPLWLDVKSSDAK